VYFAARDFLFCFLWLLKHNVVKLSDHLDSLVLLNSVVDSYLKSTALTCFNIANFLFILL
jgi:hypothetical protein